MNTGTSLGICATLAGSLIIKIHRKSYLASSSTPQFLSGPLNYTDPFIFRWMQLPIWLLWDYSWLHRDAEHSLITSFSSLVQVCPISSSDLLTAFSKMENQFCVVVSSIIALISISEEIVQKYENNWCVPKHPVFCRHSDTNSSVSSLRCFPPEVAMLFNTPSKPCEESYKQYSNVSRKSCDNI